MTRRSTFAQPVLTGVQHPSVKCGHSLFSGHEI